MQQNVFWGDRKRYTRTNWICNIDISADVPFQNQIYFQFFAKWQNFSLFQTHKSILDDKLNLAALTISVFDRIEKFW